MATIFNEITFYGGGNELMNSMITKTIDQVNMERKAKDTMGKLGFTPTIPLSENETYGSVNWVNELPVINENGTKEEMELSVSPSKGYKIVEYGEKITSSFLFGQWLKTAKTLVGATSDLQAKFIDTGKKAKKLMQAADKSMAYEMTKVYTKGFSITAAHGAGSATPKGQPLFSTSHTIYKTGGTFSNLQTGALSETTLKAAIKLHIAMRLENGDRVEQPRTEGYTLFVSPDKELEAKVILNNGSSLAGTANNSALENVFTFDGSRVKLEVMDHLAQYDRAGDLIGTTAMWFLVNMPMLKQTEAFKAIKLYTPFVKHYMNDETDQSIVDIREWFTCDSFWAEYAIVGSTGA